jgi:hypothetical protein
VQTGPNTYIKKKIITAKKTINMDFCNQSILIEKKIMIDHDFLEMSKKIKKLRKPRKPKKPNCEKNRLVRF